MRKKNLVILTCIGWVLFVAGAIFFGNGAITMLSTQAHCAANCRFSPFNFSGIITGYLLIFAAMVFHLIALVGVLIKQAKRQQWAWFVCNLIFGQFCTLIYLIAVKELSPAELRAEDQRLKQARHRTQASARVAQKYNAVAASPVAAKQPGPKRQNPPASISHSTKKGGKQRKARSPHRNTGSNKAVLAKIAQKSKED